MGGYVNFSGSEGTDWSENAPAIGTLGSLLKTIPINRKRAKIGVQNQSANTLYLVRQDDAVANQTILTLVPNDDWETQTFKGTLLIYGAPGSQLAAWED
jgi:hypothetical protein